MPHFELAAHKREATGEPITFEMRGERFTCAPSVPDWAGVELAAADENDPTAAAQALIRFILVALVPDDEERFRELVRRKWRPRVEEQRDGDWKPAAHMGPRPEPTVLDEGWEPIVREELEALVGWLAGVYTGRPSTPSSLSGDGRRSNGGTWTAGSDSPVTRTGPAQSDGGGS